MPPRTGPRCAPAPRRARRPTTATAGPGPSRRRTARAAQKRCAAAFSALSGSCRSRTAPPATDAAACRLTASAHRVTVSAKTGSASNNSRAIPGYWLPCPVNNHAVVGGSVHSPRTTPGRVRLSAKSASASRALWTESTTSAARCSKCERPAPAVKHTSAMSTFGWVFNHSSYRCANAISASGDRADSASTSIGSSGASDSNATVTSDKMSPVEYSSAVADCGGASSISTCAFVPVKPKELIPARRGLPLACHGIALSTTRTGSESHGICGDGVSKCRLCGSTSCCSDNTTLIRPATPDADSRWPMLVFTDPISNGRSASRAAP